MKILVCVKQVPNTADMTIDHETHRLVRQGVASILNPADRTALERALRLREQYGGRVTVVIPSDSVRIAASPANATPTICTPLKPPSPWRKGSAARWRA